MLEIELLKNFFIALALGALIGLEREYAKHKGIGHSYAGIRTFPLIALLGAISAYLSDIISIWILITGLIIIGVISLLAYFAVSDKTHIGATTEIAGILTFFIGVIAYQGEIVLASILAVTITVILYSRSMLHNFTNKIKKAELGATLTFAVISLVILPLLPNTWYFGYFNPFIVWLMVVFISAISFAGYILLKMFGERGILLTGIFGGLVSSTAVTTSFSARSVKEKKIFRSLALGVILANAIMFIMILIEVFVVNRLLFYNLFVPITSLFLVTIILSFFVWRKSKNIKSKIELGSPLTLRPTLKFAAFFAVITALVKLANAYFSSSGVYMISFISGFIGVDAITLSLSQLARDSLLMETARNGIIVAALTNVAVKGGIAWWFGGKEFRNLVAGLFLVLILLGIGLMLLL